MNLEYAVTEAISRIKGTITEIKYEFEEFNVEQSSFGIAHVREKRSRIFDMSTTREQYNRTFNQNSNLLSFDNFILVIRPFVMGYYLNDELEQAFKILDKNSSGYITVEKLAVFLPVINDNVTIDAVKNYIKNINLNNTDNLTYDDFRTLILRGIGRDIICHRI
jgi:Ca2+-binding EF-hand superfamily protein